MNLSDLVNHATDKERFHRIEHYIDLWAFLDRRGQALEEVAIKKEDGENGAL